MAACSSFPQIFENQLPENPSLIDSLSSWKQIKSPNRIDHSFTEIFGELHFKESPSSSSSSSSTSSINDGDKYTGRGHRSSDSFSSMNSESLQLCTEGLGFESLDDVGDLKNEANSCEMENGGCVKSYSGAGNYQYKRAKSCERRYPPPISCIGRSGKPWVCFKPYRHEGRFVLQEVRIPTQEFLHACREDGRLRLSFVQADDDFLHDQEEEEESYEEEDGDGKVEEEVSSSEEYDVRARDS